MVFEIDLPLTLSLPIRAKRKKKKKDTETKETTEKPSRHKLVYLNLNKYRNLTGADESNMKRHFKKQIIEKVQDTFETFEFKRPIQITYSLFIPDKRGRDVANVCSIVDKYFSDVIVREGIIEDDNFRFLSRVIYQYGGEDLKGAGFVRARIEYYKGDTVEVLNERT